MVISLLDVDRDSSAWKLILCPFYSFVAAAIINTLVMSFNGGMFQLSFLEAYDLRLEFPDEDVKIPSVCPQSS